jgi:hypothetical protein
MKIMLQGRETYEFDRSISYNDVAPGAGAKVVTLEGDTSNNLYVPEDSKSSSMRFLFFFFSISFELAEGGDRIESVLSMVSSTLSLSRLLVVLRASSSKEADSSRISPTSGSGGHEEKTRWFYKI